MSVSDKETATAVHAAGDDDTLKRDQAEEAVVMPESLRNMSDEDISQLRKKMVRKMDMVIM